MRLATAPFRDQSVQVDVAVLLLLPHDRGLPLLEAELRLTRGLARARAGVRGAEEDLDQAVALAERASACLLEGRARLLRRRAGFLRNDLDRTRACLAGDAIWAAAAALPQPGEREPW